MGFLPDEVLSLGRRLEDDGSQGGPMNYPVPICLIPATRTTTDYTDLTDTERCGPWTAPSGREVFQVHKALLSVSSRVILGFICRF